MRWIVVKPRWFRFASVLLLWVMLSDAQAEVITDLGLFYYSDSFAYSGTTSTYNRMMWDFGIALGLGKKSSWALGWNYDSMSFSENTGTVNKLTVTDMGPKITYYIDKDRAWFLAFTYDLITKGSYSAAGAAAVELRGTAMKADFGYTPPITDNFFIGGRISYYKPAFSESVVNTTITKTTNSRAVIYPSFSLTYRWQ